ncbi:hypothetical protein ACFSX5_12915 [Devosia albogilva]|uniref:Invasion associated locus B (IalB) protein n=1 Tax=Devosia albogilva TaxID=429726 RepID=A0ABW5QLY7_9HYPH
MPRTAVALLLAAIAVAPASADPFAHSSGEWREYHRDWLASCPDRIIEDAPDYYGYSCFASTGSAELNSANLPAYKLTLVRNRLDGELDLAVTVAADDVSVDESRDLVLSFGSEPPLRLAFDSDLETRFNTVNQYFISDAATRDRLLELMKAGNAVTLSVPVSGGGEHEVRLSLRGVMASLDFMSTYARRVAQY